MSLLKRINDKYHIILASNSPRRKELLEGLGIKFSVNTLKDLDESYPKDLPGEEVAEYLAKKKAGFYKSHISKDDLIITADTVVIMGSEILNKPASKKEAENMLQQLSGNTHKVLTGVCLSTQEKTLSFSSSTAVTFSDLSDSEIDYYINTFQPFDKAGAYGIQEWIGYVGVEKIDGSFYNVMGLPLHRLYEELKNF